MNSINRFQKTASKSFDFHSVFSQDRLTSFFQGFKSIKLTRPNSGKIIRIVPIILLALVIIGALYFATRAAKIALSQPKVVDNRIDIKGPIATVTVNKTLEIPIKNEFGKEITKIKYTIESAELRDELIVQGQRAISVRGRHYMVLNIKLTNDYDKSIDLNTVNYVRLGLNAQSPDWLAADIHNDPVTIQPMSTKLTRLGFPVDDKDKKMTLRIGEINGEKQTVSIDF